MNLICKLKRFMHLRAKGVPMKSALREFNHPLTAGDKYALALIACIVAISITLSYKREIDDSLTIAIERVLVSALNGVYVENGRKVTMCRIGASGECK